MKVATMSRNSGNGRGGSLEISSSANPNQSQRVKFCYCGVISRKRTAFTDENLGRCFYGCGNFQVIC